MQNLNYHLHFQEIKILQISWSEKQNSYFHTFEGY